VRITHLSKYDLIGGAARSAYRLQTGLRLAGQDSWMLVLEKQSADPAVLRFQPPRDLRTRARRGLQRRFLGRSETQIPLPAGASFFSDDRSQHGADVLRQLRDTEILNLHWVAGLIDYRAFFPALPNGIPIVWTLHDMNPFTGGCHFDDGCGRYIDACGCCPQLGSSDPQDISSDIWSRKKAAYSGVAGRPFHLVAPSRWLAQEAGKSSLFADFPTTVIPYGIDTDLFQPRDKRQAREELKIPEKSFVVLFLADSVSERRKGFTALTDALHLLKDIQGLCLLAVGRGAKSTHLEPRVVSLDYIGDENRLSVIYSAADIFLLPTLQDNFPNTALEALACGLPVIGSMVGGVPEIVRDGMTGALVEAGNPNALASAIEDFARNPERRKEMSVNCRRVAVEEYSLEIQARRYVELYKSLLRVSS
jgi:glycosyltransferase involved in cell wall biosynthesis